MKTVKMVIAGALLLVLACLVGATVVMNLSPTSAITAEEGPVAFQENIWERLFGGEGSTQPFVSRNEVLDLMSEIDQIHNLSRAGASYDDFRYEVVSGVVASSALLVKESGNLTGMRIACDDICTGVMLVRGDSVIDLTDSFVVYVPEEANSEPYETFTAFADVADWTVLLGASPDDILTQWVANDLTLSLSPGDYIVINALDDENLKVNVGVFVSWIWAQVQPTSD